MTTLAPRYTNIEDIRVANKNRGYYWFSPDTLRIFKSRVVSRIYDAGTSVDYPKGSRLWIESTRNYNDCGREWHIARFNVDTADISYVHVDYTTLTFASKRTAERALEAML